MPNFAKFCKKITKEKQDILHKDAQIIRSQIWYIQRNLLPGLIVDSSDDEENDKYETDFTVERKEESDM